MSTINDLMKVCVELAKVKNPALCSVSKAVISSEELQKPYPTAIPGDLCIFSWKTKKGRAGQAGLLSRVAHDELVFERVGNTPGHIWRVWREQPGLVITRVVVVAAPELDVLLRNPSGLHLQNSADTIYKRLKAAKRQI